jgi:gamma-glutamylcyclotransferase (GGCT)/AIG2-like uncharacterized protein YtfP
MLFLFMAPTFTKTDTPSLNFFLKTINDARYQHQTIPSDQVISAIKEKFPTEKIRWLPEIEDILQDAETKLFSYGSLQPGEQNEHMLTHIKGYWLEGYVYGERLQLGWGTYMGFPVLKPDYTGHKPQVQGKLFVASGLVDNWERLDEFEGEDYTRVLTLVYTIDPEQIIISNVYAASAKVS